ncbi:MAG: bifunctional hydroxymethylpyrimidine kinase/phosphomethylpyrimidine kinase [Candidatus Aminicenantia bacterium]
MKKSLLSIAGFDPTCGAGVSLDIRVFEYLGFKSLGIITSLAIQNTREVKEILSLPSNIILSQYRTLKEDVKIDGVKVGMIGSEQNLTPVAEILKDLKGVPKVVDPVFKSSSGAWLLEEKAMPEFINKIIPLADIITPNLEEASLITKIKTESLEDMEKAAQIIYQNWKTKSIIKGGHLPGNRAVDIIFDGDKFHFLENEKTKTKVHGTGCFFSSALLGYLSKNHSFFEACELAKKLTFKAIKNSKKIGKGQRIINVKCKA